MSESQLPLHNGECLNMHLSFRNILSSLTSIAAGLSVAASGAGILPVLPAHATDIAAIETSGGEQQNGRFLRIGLAKSAVIRLPTEAKDVIVGDSAVVDVVLRQKNMAYLFARTVGQTNVFFFDANGQEILHLDLEVALDSKGLKKLIDRSIPGNGIEVDTTGSNIVLKGTASTAQEAKMAEDLARRFIFDVSNSGDISPVINLLRVEQGDQVMLKVRIIELKRSVLKQLGINLEGSLGGVSLQSKPVSTLDDLGNELFESVVGLGSGGNSIDVTIKALEEQGLATTLAEPTLTAISGASASFLAGGEYPYRECEENNNGLECSIEFKPYGVTLGFTPTVLAENRIALNINTEVSELGERIFGIPAIDTRKAQTSVEIPSGGSMMLAGLIKDVTSQDLDGVPGLRNLPVLGALFSSRDYQRNQTELVVIVTPYIAKPVHHQELATPLDRFNQPTDLQQIFLGRLNRVYGTAGRNPEGVYHGKVGHIID